MSVDFTPLRPRDHAWAAPWHPSVILPRLSPSLPLVGRRMRSGRALRAGEQVAPGTYRRTPWDSL